MKIPILWRSGENFKEIFDGVVFNSILLLALIVATSFWVAAGTKWKP